MRKSIRSIMAGTCALLMCTPMGATAVTSPRVDVSLSAFVLDSITVSVANPTVAWGAVATGTSNPAPLAQSISIVSAWNLGEGITVRLYAYFDSASNAMTGAVTGQLIPTSAITGSVNGGSAQNFSATSPFTSGATAMQLYSVPITTANLVVTRTDTLALTLNLVGLTPQADTYAGVMHLQAQAL